MHPVTKANQTLERMRDRVDSLALAFHASFIDVRTQLARSRRRSARPPTWSVLLAELPGLGLGAQLGARFSAWMFAPPQAAGLEQVRALLVDAPADVDVPWMSPLEWHHAACATLGMMHEAFGTLGATPPVLPLLETFCASAATSMADVDLSPIRTRCYAVLAGAGDLAERAVDGT